MKLVPLTALTLAACGSGVHSNPSPVGENVTLRAGSHHSCLVKSDGSVWCWGRNQYGELGVPKSTDTSHPVQAQFQDAIAVSPGMQSTCGIKSDSTGWCWGRIIDGSFIPTPNALPNGDNLVQLELAEGGLCALKSDSSVWCWSRAGSPSQLTAMQVIAKDATQVTFDCALMRDGTVQCWGPNNHGQLGDGTTSGTGPVQVMGLADVVEIGAGHNGNCARKRDGSVWCWGDNTAGQLGVSPTSTVCPAGNNMWPCRPTAGAIPGLPTATAMATGGSFVITLVDDGTLVGVGDNGVGELGTPTGNCGDPLHGACSFTPVAVPTVAQVSRFAAGDAHVCVCQSDGAVLCWGQELPATPTVIPGVTCN
ncbi:MAG: repeat-containing protein [Myxococcales bacterium]|nr:repeat-containing protein [Myxococcales bacterium]